VDNVKVPEVVTGVPVILNNPVESANPTLVTVPELAPLLVIVILEPLGVIVIPVPPIKVRAPVKLFRLDTPELLPPVSGRST
jgi:hypothetical protein